jgi:hypothetical protein
MKRITTIILSAAFILLAGQSAGAQESNGWSMTATGKNVSAMTSGKAQFTWHFSRHDTLHFQLNEGETLIEKFRIEFAIVSAEKEVTVFITTEKNLNEEQNRITVPIDEVYRAVEKYPSVASLSFRMYIRDDNGVAEKADFRLQE